MVKLRYFAGLSVEETAACLGIAPVTAKRYWAVARAWLYAALSDVRGDRAQTKKFPRRVIPLRPETRTVVLSRRYQDSTMAHDDTRL